jgi:hypothetical protein
VYSGLAGKRQIGRPSTVANFRKQILAILQERPDLASLEILRQGRQAGDAGGKTALYALVASLRPKPIKPVVRLKGSRESLVSTILGKWWCSSSMVRAREFISSPHV